jgi:hypothetical protein
MIALALVSGLLAAEPLKSSPCLAAKPSPRISLAEIPADTPLTLGHDAVQARVDETPAVVCVDGDRIIGIGFGLALAFSAKTELLKPLPPSQWTALRQHLKDDPMQTGCLKRLPKGTVLYDRADGDEVGLVLESLPYGKWDTVKTKSGTWSMLKVNVGFAPVKVWIKDPSPDWCPK